jgi:hypothetical protein
VSRYFFNVVEGNSKNLVRDSEGIVLSGVREARKEAIGLARDVVRHGFYDSIQAWKIVVTDENGDEVLTVHLSEVRARKILSWLDLRGCIAKFQSSFSPHTFSFLITAAVLAIIVQVAVTTVLIIEPGRRYQTASAPTEGGIVAVRFVPDASAAEITKFLEAFNASVVGGPRPGGFYHLRIADRTLPHEELAKTVGRMAQETVVEFAAGVE